MRAIISSWSKHFTPRRNVYNPQGAGAVDRTGGARVERIPKRGGGGAGGDCGPEPREDFFGIDNTAQRAAGRATLF